jgi:hypothetical protein
MAGEPLATQTPITGFKLTRSLIARTPTRNVAHHWAVTVTSFGKTFTFLLIIVKR